MCFELFLQYRFLHEGVEARLLTGGGVFFDNIFLSRFVEALDSEFKFRLCGLYILCYHCFTSFLDGAFEDTFYDLVSIGLLGSDAHVFLGGVFDRHTLSKIN